MESVDIGAPLLKEKYDLHKAPEVKLAADRTQARTGEEVPQDPLAQIGNYLDRFREITGRVDPADREHGINAAKILLHSRFVIKPDQIPESYFDNQRRLAREQGHGDLEITQEARDRLTEVIFKDQKSSIDKWIDYLASPDALYSDGFKYYILRSVLSMGAYDKEKHAFSQRTKETISPFPDLNREALGIAIDIVNKRISNRPDFARIDQQIKQTRNKIKSLNGELRKGNTSVQADLESYQALLNSLRKEEDILLGLGDIFDPQEGETTDQKEGRLNDRSQLHQDIEKANFAQLYAWAIEKVTPASKEQLKTTDGIWVRYDQGSDPLPLVQSLQGHGTGWCTAGESTAQAQLQAGDFYVYYSLDSKGEPVIPRVAIRMDGNSIAEVRGIAEEQNLDPYVAPVVEQKLEEFPDGKKYLKRVEDMKRLTQIEDKSQRKNPLDVGDLKFLYEIDSEIEGFGYQRDPRIKELRLQRDPIVDISIVFECEPSQIAQNPEEINEHTKAYLGELKPGIFDQIRRFNLDHVYTSFPEGRIRLETVKIGGKTSEELQRELSAAGIYVEKNAESMMRSEDITTLHAVEELDIVRLRVADLAGTNYKSLIHIIFGRAEELGLGLCPAEVAPNYILQHKDSFGDAALTIASRPIVKADGRRVKGFFKVGHQGARSWVRSTDADSYRVWDQDDELVFSLGARVNSQVVNLPIAS